MCAARLLASFYHLWDSKSIARCSSARYPILPIGRFHFSYSRFLNTAYLTAETPNLRFFNNNKWRHSVLFSAHSYLQVWAQLSQWSNEGGTFHAYSACSCKIFKIIFLLSISLFFLLFIYYECCPTYVDNVSPRKKNTWLGLLVKISTFWAAEDRLFTRDVFMEQSFLITDRFRLSLNCFWAWNVSWWRQGNLTRNGIVEIEGRDIYTTKIAACVCVCVCKIWPISARTLSFRHQTSRKFFSHSNFPICYLWATAFCVCPLCFTTKNH